MKKIFHTFFFALAVLTTYAQTELESSNHLSFKGVPINGTLSEFVSKMQKSGFIQEETRDGITILKGDFATYKNCIVEVSTLKQKDLVSKIAVKFPACETWSTLSTNYFTLKKLLTEKYGKASEIVEEFQSYTPDSDRSKMIKVEHDECKYYSSFTTEKGTIHLAIDHLGPLICFVRLVYNDKINGETLKQQALEDL